MKYQCKYCPEESTNFKEFIQHFNQYHKWAAFEAELNKPDNPGEFYILTKGQVTTIMRRALQMIDSCPDCEAIIDQWGLVTVEQLENEVDRFFKPCKSILTMQEGTNGEK